jgi:hypothetical protein
MTRSPWRWDPYHNSGEFGRTDQAGTFCPPVWVQDTVHGCSGTCRMPDFPGRAPKVGDIALCGHGMPGVILNAERQEVTYRDGKSLAWAGVHLSPTKAGQPWSSRNPCIIGSVGEMKEGESLAEFVMRRWPIDWPSPNFEPAIR